MPFPSFTSLTIFPSTSVDRLHNNTDPERQPLLSNATATEQQRALAPKPQIRTSHVEAFRRSQFGMLWEQYTNHKLILDDGKPNIELVQRMVRKFLIQTAFISRDMAASVAAGVVSAVVSRAILSRFSGQDRSVLTEAVIDSMRFLFDRTPTTAMRNQLSMSENAAMGILFLATLYEENQRGGQGMEFALATQLSAGTTRAISEIVNLMMTLYPTRGEDLKAIYNTIMSRDKDLIAAMPEDRKYSVTVLLNELDINLVTPINRGGSVNVEYVRSLLEALDVQLQMWKNMIKVPENKWLYDVDTPEAVAQRERINFLEETISKQVSPNETSQKAVKAFVERARLQTSHRWNPDTDGKGLPVLNILVAVGGSGTGKTYLGKVLVEMFGVDAVEIGFKYLISYMAPPDGEDTRGGTEVSPYDAHKQFIVVMLKDKVAMIICNEADLKGNGDQGMGKNQAYIDLIKRATERDGTGIIILEGLPKHTRYIIDLRDTPIYITTNIMPDDKAFLTRVGIAEINGIPLPERRKAAKLCVDNWFNRELSQYFILSDEQKRAIRHDMAGLMEFIIDASLEDIGPSNMKIVIIEIAIHLARTYADGEREVPDKLHLDDLLEGKPDPVHGPHWSKVPPDEIDQELKLLIEASFQKHREGSLILNLLERAKRKLDEEAEANGGTPPIYPDATSHFKLAEEAKLGAKDTIIYVEKALMQQWQGPLENKPSDIQKAVRALATDALMYLTYIYGSDETMRESPGYKYAEFYLKFLDRIMRVPTTLKNVSHWETGGNKDERERVHDALVNIEDYFGDDKHKRLVREVLGNYVDSTLPVASESASKESNVSKKPNTLFICGPGGAGKDFVAKEIISGLGLRRVPMTVQKFLSLMKAEDVARDQDKTNTTPEEALGDFNELLTGDSIDAVLHFSGEELEHLTDAEKSELNTFLSPYAPNPAVTLHRSPGVHFKVEMAGLLKIFTMRKDDGSFSNARSVSLGTPTKEIQRNVAARIFEQEVHFLNKIDLPYAEKEKIVNVCFSMMEYIMSVASKNDGGPSLLGNVVSSLFSFQRSKAQQSIMAKGKQAAGATEQEGLGELSFTWVESSSDFEELPAELVKYVNTLFKQHRDAEKNAKDASVAKPAQPPQPQAAKPQAATPQETAQSAPPAGSQELEELVRKLGDQETRRTVAALIDKVTADLPPTVPEKGQRLISSYFSAPSNKLFDAIQNGKVEEIKRTLEDSNYLKLLERKNDDGESVFHMGVKSGEVEIIRVLLQDRRALTGAAIVDKKGRTALHAAAELGNQEIVEELLKASIQGKTLFDPKQTDGGGATPLILAVIGGDIGTVEALSAHEHTDVNAKDGNGETALHHAVNSKKGALIDILLANSEVNVNLTNKEGLTAAMIALKTEQKDLVPRLM